MSAAQKVGVFLSFEINWARDAERFVFPTHLNRNLLVDLMRMLRASDERRATPKRSNHHRVVLLCTDDFTFFLSGFVMPNLLGTQMFTKSHCCSDFEWFELHSGM